MQNHRVYKHNFINFQKQYQYYYNKNNLNV